ncbi:Probable mediator of RNA polymerase II transcription subunit 26b [Striga hermonthica]|uniref:Probable mediator of RNA polymerase II transcription subunit 26b n=1 Tax=Striga hermonthica TaxID=68872 RepID=A0A9N7RLX7_STRHE|nr:Probable mediator of RNA polymerase II transcription subunit 26b [Striga hermonthica]
MADTSIGLDKWRDYFRGANSDIFAIIEHAIMVAASDSPYEFKVKRDRIAEMLFTCKITKCFGCDRVELNVPKRDCAEKNGYDDDDDDDDDKCKSGIVEVGGSKDTQERKLNRRRDNDNDDDDDDDHKEIVEMNLNKHDAEALTDELEEAARFYEEVLRIRGIVDNGEHESDEVLFDSLRRLQLMHLSVETLKTTEIGKSVNALRKHRSIEIRDLSRTLINNWKIMVDEWVNATTAIAGAEATTESVKTSAVEEDEGLPSPPLDEGAFFATPASMELSQFFDGMDDDGNPQNCGEFNKNRENGRKRRPEKTGPFPKRDFRVHGDPNPPLNDKLISEFEKNQEPISRKTTRPCGPDRPRPPNNDNGVMKPKPVMQMKVKNEKKSDQVTILKKPVPNQQEELKCNNEDFVRTKLEAAKRKLQERYQEAENAKKQRTIQVVELHDLPKRSLAQSRPSFQHRQRSNGRR